MREKQITDVYDSVTGAIIRFHARTYDHMRQNAISNVKNLIGFRVYLNDSPDDQRALLQ